MLPISRICNRVSCANGLLRDGSQNKPATEYQGISRGWEGKDAKKWFQILQGALVHCSTEFVLSRGQGAGLYIEARELGFIPPYQSAIGCWPLPEEGPNFLGKGNPPEKDAG